MSKKAKPKDPAAGRTDRARSGVDGLGLRPPLWRAGVLLLLAALVVAVLTIKATKAPPAPPPVGMPASAQLLPVSRHGLQPTAGATGGLPRLVDLGADSCIPCKAMVPILAELRSDYAGRMRVDFIDVWKNPEAGESYRIWAIPTQVFYDPSGRELSRHQGFISKAEILATWSRHGFDFSSGPVGPPEI